MTVLGGAGTLIGPLLGVTVFELAKEVISHYTEHWYGVLGALFIGCTLFMPHGIHGLIVGLGRQRRRKWDAAPQATPALPSEEKA
jgi:branched-chain amino acid transport system permease protein